MKAVATYLLREEVPLTGSRALLQQNKPDGFMCVSCAWAKPAKPHTAEFCENGAKATAWELTGKRMPASLLRRPHARRTAYLERPRPRSRRPPHRAAALRPADRPLRRVQLGGSLRRHRRRAQGPARRRPEVGGVLRLGPRQPREQLHVPVDGTPLRQQQPARQLEHVPRKHLCGPSEDHRRSCRHRHPRRLRAHRRHLLLRAERRREQPAHAPPVAGRTAAARHARSSPSTRCARPAS